MAKVLLVEDDLLFAALIESALKEQGYLVDFAEDGAIARHFLDSYSYDLLILDWTLPGNISGLQICSLYRKRDGVAPIMFVTGKTSIAEKVTAFDSGSDDYLTKPFHIYELVLRAKALLRRPRAIAQECLQIGALQMDTKSRSVNSAGEAIDILPRDYRLLEFLMKNPNQFFSAEAIRDRVWKSESSASTAAIRQSVFRLRKILGDSDCSILVSKYKAGYMLSLSH